MPADDLRRTFRATGLCGQYTVDDGADGIAQPGGTVQTLTATVTATSGGASVNPGVVNFTILTSVAAASPRGGYTARPLLIGTAQVTSSGTASIKVILGGGATHTLTAKFLRTRLMRQARLPRCPM